MVIYSRLIIKRVNHFFLSNNLNLSRVIIKWINSKCRHLFRNSSLINLKSLHHYGLIYHLLQIMVSNSRSILNILNNLLNHLPQKMVSNSRLIIKRVNNFKYILNHLLQIIFSNRRLVFISNYHLLILMIDQFKKSNLKTDFIYCITNGLLYKFKLFYFFFILFVNKFIEKI